MLYLLFSEDLMYILVGKYKIDLIYHDSFFTSGVQFHGIDVKWTRSDVTFNGKICNISKVKN